MFDLDKAVRSNILALSPYSSARDEFKGSEGIFLDANESPFGELNRYPDPYQKNLKMKLSEIKGISPKKIFIGNGSDEIIDISFRVFCEPGTDQALTFTPTYGMYRVSADINNVKLLEVPLNDYFEIRIEMLDKLLANSALKLIFICSPNNPTGNTMNETAVEYLLKHFQGIVFIDEAYIDFSSKKSWISRLDEYPNLVVSQTFSKARGYAAARVGMAFTSEKIIHFFNKVKPPYNVSSLNQKAAFQALQNSTKFEQNRLLILSEKEHLIDALLQLTFVKQVFQSDANFVLVKMRDAEKVYLTLARKKIIIRNRHSVIPGCLRITVGSPEENECLIKALKTILI